MKKVTIECEVEDFCPADCTALNPYRWGLDDTVRCLSVDNCRNLHKALLRAVERCSKTECPEPTDTDCRACVRRWLHEE